MASRASKRPRTQQVQSAYSDIIPLNGNYGMVYSTDAGLRNIGSSYQQSRTNFFMQHTEQSWQNISSWNPPDDESFVLAEDGSEYNAKVEADVLPDPQAASKPKRSVVTKRPHVVWIESNQQVYLDEIMRWDGRGDFLHAKECPDCLARGVEKDSAGSPIYRCRECIYPDLVCQMCCVKRHRMHPFHRIQQWIGTQFTDVTLSSMGLCIQLNHLRGYCENPVAAHTSMLILHTNGIHNVPIRYCGCVHQIPHHLQLLRRRLYPASQIMPKTCGTFELLRHLHKLVLTTKSSMYDFYRCLEKSTCNTGMGVPKSRYRALMRMVLQWRHLQMLRWAGRGQEAEGISKTTTGQLAVQCPSCPRPGINLPADWRDAPNEKKFLYVMIICMDANFRLKNQIVSNYSQDPGMGIGWAYMVPCKPYRDYMLSRTTDKDISTCVGFQALAKSNTKFSKGLRYTGVNLTVCGRSEMVLPAGVGNLQKGERYSNMDYIFGSTLQFVTVLCVLISYDIACQWFINLLKRIENDWSDEITPPAGLTLTPAIPKLHEPAHQTKNHQMYSFNYLPGVGLTDGECPERVWTSHNLLANSTKTQGPGSRQDVLNDHFGNWNWLKYISTGTTLLRRYKAAVIQRNLQQEGHWGLTELLDAGLVARWEKMCTKWENALHPKKKVDNPYFAKDSGLTEVQVQKEMADEEAAHLSSGGTFPHKMSSSSFIHLGLELEDAQQRLQRDAKDASKSWTDKKVGTLAEQRNGLLTRIRAWELLLPLYIPGLLQCHTNNPPPPATSENVDDATIWLPSQIPQPHRDVVCMPGLVDIEKRMRHAQLVDSLNAVRRILKIKSRMIHFKNKNLHGQHDGTRSTTVIDSMHERARFAAGKYREACVAYLALQGHGKWEKKFQYLNKKDVRGYQDPNQLWLSKGRRGTLEDDQVQTASEGAPAVDKDSELSLYVEARTKWDGSGETRRTLSWIWKNAAASSNNEEDDLLRVEWAKSRARALREKEEVMLLKEEMRCVLEFMSWKSRWWVERCKLRPGVSIELAEGVSAFASLQNNLQVKLAQHFQELWKRPLQDTPDPPADVTEVDDEEENDNASEEEPDGLYGDDDVQDSEDEDIAK